MMIKTSASLVQRNRPVFVEIEVAGKSFPRKQIFFPEKSKIDPVFHLPKSAKKLDGEESRTILLNGNEVIPSNCMPNVREVFVHTCFDEELRIEGSSVDEASVLEDGVAFVVHDQFLWPRLAVRLASLRVVLLLHSPSCFV